MKLYSAKYLKTLIITGLTIFTAHFQAFSQTYQVNGAAVDKGNGLVRLTASGIGNQTASAWNTTKIDLTQPFDMTFEMFFGCDNGPNGGDGMTFTLQNDPRGLNATGAGFGFLGIGGSAAEMIKPALSIEFDTYDGTASGGSNEISADHIAIDLNGDVNVGQSFTGASGTAVTVQATGIQNFPTGRDLEDCAVNSNNFYTIRIKWTPGTPGNPGTLKLYEEGNTTPSVTYTNDLITNLFGNVNEVYWGFTGATGSASNEQWIAPQGSIIPWECSAATSCCTPFTVTPTSPTTICNNPVTLSVADTYTSYSWSDGTTGTTTQISVPGTYTLNVFQTQGANLCPGSATFTITPTGPTAALSGATTLCNASQTTPLSVALTGSSPWTLVYAIDGISQPPVTGITSSPYVFQANGSHVYSLVSVSDNSGCNSSATGSATVDLYPGVPVGHDDVFTAPGTADLSVDDDGGTYIWYDAPTGGTQVNTGLTFTTPVLNGTTTYYVENTAVTSLISKSVSFKNNSEGNGADTAYNDHSGLPPAVLFINFTANSSFNFDTISCDVFALSPWTSGGINLTITDLTTSTPVSFNPTYGTPLSAGKHSLQIPLNYACTAGHNYKISYEGTGSLKGYVYWRMVTGYPINIDPEITLTGATQAESYPGLFDWKISVPSPSSSCGRTPVTAYTCPKANLSGDATICNDGSTTPLTVDFTGRQPYTLIYAIDGVSQPVLSNISMQHYVFQSLPGAHTYSLVSVSNADCNGSVSGTATVSLTAQSPIGHDANFTAPGTADLSVNATGDTFEWYDSPTGGNLVYTGNNYTTPVLNGTTTYYVNNASVINIVKKSVSFKNNSEGNGADTAYNDHSGLPPAVLFINFTANSSFNFDTISCDVFALSPWTSGGIYLTITDLTTSTPVSFNPTYGTPLSAGKHSIQIPLNYACTAGHNYQISYEGTGSLKGYVYWRMVTGYPINTDPEITLTGATQTESYPGLFDWKISIVSSTPACGRTPVTAYVCPTAALSGDAVICNDGISTTPLSVALTGNSPWSLTYAIDGVIQTTLTGISSPNPYLITSATGAHVYSLVSVSNATSTGCANGTSGSASVTVKPDAPVGHDATFTKPGTAILSVDDNAGSTYNWYTTPSGGISINTGATFTTPTLTVSTTYYVEQIIAGEISCTRTPVTAIVFVPNVALFIPNLMTPNNDGKNDRFEILGLPNGSALGIYNRWGNAIYQSDNYDNQWAAENTSSGVYYYDLKLKNGESYKGWLQIMP